MHCSGRITQLTKLAVWRDVLRLFVCFYALSNFDSALIFKAKLRRGEKKAKKIKTEKI